MCGTEAIDTHYNWLFNKCSTRQSFTFCLCQPFEELYERSFRYLAAECQGVRILAEKLLDQTLFYNRFNCQWIFMNPIWQVNDYTFSGTVLLFLPNTVMLSFTDYTKNLGCSILKDFTEKGATFLVNYSPETSFSITKLSPLHRF